MKGLFTYHKRTYVLCWFHWSHFAESLSLLYLI